MPGIHSRASRCPQGQSWHVSCSFMGSTQASWLFFCRGSCCGCWEVLVLAAGTIMEYKILHPQNNVLQFVATPGSWSMGTVGETHFYHIRQTSEKAQFSEQKAWWSQDFLGWWLCTCRNKMKTCRVCFTLSCLSLPSHIKNALPALFPGKMSQWRRRCPNMKCVR